MLILVLSAVMDGCRRKSEDVRDLNSVRAELREQVARGHLSREEAVVRLAEATREAKFGSRKKDRAPKKDALSPELDALGKDLKARIDRGEMTEAEAKAAWFEAAAKTQRKSPPKESGKDMKGKP
jgi:hypothetical protein